MQDYLMSDADKARLLKDLESDIGFTDETFESDIVDSNSNEESQDESDLF